MLGIAYSFYFFMEKVTFSIPELNDRFTITGDDVTIDVPGKYMGKLSQCPNPDVIAAMISRGSKLVTEKATGNKKPDANANPGDTTKK